jgi:hypothetical protein
MWEQFRRNADAVVTNADLYFILPCTDAQQNLAAVRRVLCCIGQQVRNNLHQACTIALNMNRFGGHLYRQLMAPALDERPHLLDCAGHDPDPDPVARWPA